MLDTQLDETPWIRGPDERERKRGMLRSVRGIRKQAANPKHSISRDRCAKMDNNDDDDA